MPTCSTTTDPNPIDTHSMSNSVDTHDTSFSESPYVHTTSATPDALPPIHNPASNQSTYDYFDSTTHQATPIETPLILFLQ